MVIIPRFSKPKSFVKSVRTEAEVISADFKINNVQIDKMNVSDTLTIKFSEVKDGIIHLTDNNWC